MLNDLRFALRSLRKAPGFTTVAVLTLALGIGATSAMFSLVDGILLRPLPYAQPERLAYVRQAYPEIGLDDWALSHENVVMYRDRVHEFASFAGYHREGATLIQDGQPRRLSVIRATGDFFHVPIGGVHGFRNESGDPASMPPPARRPIRRCSSKAAAAR